MGWGVAVMVHDHVVRCAVTTKSMHAICVCVCVCGGGGGGGEKYHSALMELSDGHPHNYYPLDCDLSTAGMTTQRGSPAVSSPIIGESYSMSLSLHNYW